MDRESFTQVLEYLAAAAAAIVIALVLSDQLAMPLWGGLTDAHLR